MEVDAEVQDIIKYRDEARTRSPRTSTSTLYADEWEDRPELRGDPL